MNERVLSLAMRRGALVERIHNQRIALAENMHPVVTVLGAADQAAAGVRWVKRRPGVVAAVVAGLVILRPVRMWRWGRRAVFVWRSVQELRARFTRGRR